MLMAAVPRKRNAKRIATNLVNLEILPGGVLRAVVERHALVQLVVEHGQRRRVSADRRQKRYDERWETDSRTDGQQQCSAMKKKEFNHKCPAAIVNQALSH
jgi:tetraacyldisaccharide-1-P 4'-kinase